MFKTVILLLGLLSLSITASALNPVLKKKSFFLSPENHFSQELYQTQNGIIAHNVENINKKTYFSQYLLIDIASREAVSILADVVRACEFDNVPVFQHLHYHVQTDSLVYFCPKNTSLLFVDQSSYTVQTSIPFSLNGSWSNAKLSTDGQNVVVLGMGPLFGNTHIDSMLVKVDMQTKQVTTQLIFDQGLRPLQYVVAFASNKNASYVATIQVQYLYHVVTDVYSLQIINNTYQLTAIAQYKAQVVNSKVIPKLLCVGDLVVVNNYKELYFLDQQGNTIQHIHVSAKSIAGDEYGFERPFMTSQYGSNILYALVGYHEDFPFANIYTVVGTAINIQRIDDYSEIQVAYGNQTSRDLMFALDMPKTLFSILDLKTLKPIYNAVSGGTDLMLTNTTYSVVKDSNVYIFDLATEALIAKVPLGKNYYYSKEQNLITFLNQTYPVACTLNHVNLTTGSVWLTKNLETKFCNYSITTLSITEHGNPEFVLSLNPKFLFHTETHGLYQWESESKSISDSQAFNLDLEHFLFYDYYQTDNRVAASYWSYYVLYNRYIDRYDINITNVPANKGFFLINTTKILALSNDTLTIITEVSNTTQKYSTLADWNSAGILQDVTGTHYALLSSDGSNPALWTYGGYLSLPGLRNEKSKAGLASSQAYWIADAPSSSVGLVRFYDISSSSKEKVLISF